MRKLLICLLVGIQALQAQNIGFNGAGFFENYDERVEQYLLDLNAPFTLRLPGGAISKFHDPYNVRKGWGMSEKSVTDWFNKTGFDEDGNGLDKWLRKTEEQPDHSYMDDLIAMQKKFPQMSVLWVVNVLNSTPEANMQAIRYMMDHGVNIVGVEAGNEVYGKYASFMEYTHDFEPIFKLIRKEYPQIKLGLVAGSNTTRRDLIKWNEDMAKYKGDFDAVVPHYYYTARELGDAYDMIPLRSAYDPKKDNKSLNKAFEKAAELLRQNDMLGEGITYFNALFPGKEVWITEWNTKPSEMLCNTVLNGGWQYEQIMIMQNKSAFLLMHNGVGPDKYCAISKGNKVDLEPDKMVRRMGYYVLQLYGNAPDAQPLKNDMSIPEPVEPAYYWFNNMSTCWDANQVLSKVKNADITIHYVGGNQLYSSCGFAGYMGKGSVKTYEIKGITTEKFSGMIPANAFGYIEIIPKR